MNSARVPFDKASLLAALVTKVQTDLKALERRQRDTQEAATHEENVPGAGGTDLESNGQPIRTVTPVSPFGRSLLGLEPGDEGVATTPRGRRAFEIVAVT